MKSRFQNRIAQWPFRRSLRVQVALGVGLPILLALAGLSLGHYWRERLLLEEQSQLVAVQLGQAITSSLRHTMLVNDRAMLAKMLRDFGAMNSVVRVQILNRTGQIMADSDTTQLGKQETEASPGCAECHRYPPATRPKTVPLGTNADMLRIAAPINNEPACVTCHPTEDSHLGILLTDMSVYELRQHALQGLEMDLIISLGLTVLVTLGLYWLVHWLVVRRVEALRRPLAAYAAGQTEARMPVENSTDEISALAQAFNRMADELNRHAREEQERRTLRQRAIVEERERIARELHDGLAQMLGYFSAKAQAVQLLLKSRQLPAAEKNLQQLEAAASDLYTDVREAILGLRMTSQYDTRWPALITNYANQFSRLSDLPVTVDIPPEVEKTVLPAETELHVLRIVQEALTNIRKHACASTAQVQLRQAADTLELIISDDGIGCDSEQAPPNPELHFGLPIMRERAQAIGAEFQVGSQPGAGTRVVVRIPLKAG